MKDKILSYYKPFINHYKPEDTRYVSWRTQSNQYLRFFQLVDNIDFNFSSILDVGCGVGDLWEYLNQNHFNLKEYKGIDILDKMIEGAKLKYPYIKDKFECIDVFDYFKKYDYVVAGGAITTRLFEDDEEQKSFGFNFIDKLNTLSEKGFVFNFLTDFTDERMKADDLFYYSPELMYTYCKMNYKNVKVLSDYGDGLNEDDCTIIVYK
jgi:SAM-dependent methyltransferase